MAYKILTAKQRDRAVDCALRVTQAAIDGKSAMLYRDFTFDLLRGGRCQEFVRECVEAGNKWAPHSWEFGDNEPSAKVASRNMRKAGYDLPKGALLVPGDILTHERGGRKGGGYGHIGMFVGVVDGISTVCENTSSGSRGNPKRPGTKRTPLRDFTYDYAFRFIKLTAVGVFVNGQQVHPHVLLLDGKAYVPRRIVAYKLGAVVEPVSHRASMVNGEFVDHIIRNGISWVWARDLARLTGATVQWSPDKIEFTQGGG